MIYQIVSVTVKPGKMPEARQHLLDIVANAKKVNSDLIEGFQILSNISVSMHQLHALMCYESLSDLEASRKRFEKDAKAQEYRAKRDDFFENDLEISLFRVES